MDVVKEISFGLTVNEDSTLNDSTLNDFPVDLIYDTRFAVGSSKWWISLLAKGFCCC